MAKEFASRTHFVHLRNVTKEMPPAPETGLGPAGCTFTESDHLGGDVDMYSIMLTMLQEKQRRRAEGWGDMSEIPFRPDHGHKMVDDMKLGWSGAMASANRKMQQATSCNCSLPKIITCMVLITCIVFLSIARGRGRRPTLATLALAVCGALQNFVVFSLGLPQPAWWRSANTLNLTVSEYLPRPTIRLS